MEEDIEILKECVEYETFGRSCKNRRNKLDNKCFTALENILNELERLQKENEEWQKAYQEEKDEQFNLLINSIPKQVIRDKIEFYKRYGKVQNSDEYVMSVEIFVLEEILGEEK